MARETQSRGGRELTGEHHHETLDRSFRHAFDGIAAVNRRERNMKIHLVMAALVVIAGIVLKIAAFEWLICLVLFGMVMGLEMVNTAMECTVDLVTEDKKQLAKLAKDAAAGAVLVSAIMAAIAGLIIFLPKIAALF